MKVKIITLAIFIISININAQDFSNGFSFTLPAYDSTTQKFLPNFKKHTISNFIYTSDDGHFTSNGKNIKFWGVNLTTGACFPNKNDAPGIAARMRKMGINLVRFHHMDNPWTDKDGSIFMQNGSTTTLNTESLDKLHYFLSKLKEEGVYANINLHVSRTFTEQDGVLYADSITDFAKGVTFFDGKLIELQKQYAKQLLTSTNPYTGISIANDPVVAMIEITNENTLYGFWKNSGLQPFSEGGSILSRHSDTLDMKWNGFLIKKYGNHDNLKNAWGNQPTTSTVNLIKDGGFENSNIYKNWVLEQHETAVAEAVASTNTPYEGNKCAIVDVTQITDTDWHVQFNQNGISVDKDSIYKISFYAKSDSPVSIYVSSFRNGEPWTWYGGSEINLTTEWREYSYTFSALESNTNLTRLSFILGANVGTYWIDNVRMVRSKKTGLEQNENLENKNIRRIRYNERLGFNEKRVADLAEFYLKVQKDYYDEMYAYLKNDLGVKCPITGSNALGGTYEPFTHGSLDFIDDHAYWDHPNFPNQAWSNWDWYISNKAMVNTDLLGTIPGLFGGLQVQGKPFTVSEYNHPQPNIYQTEMLPILTGYGSFHGSDAFMFFEYNGGNPANWDIDIQNHYFRLHRNTPIMALFPLFSYAFRNNLIKEDPNPILIKYSNEYMFNMPQQDGGFRWSKYYPYDRNIALTKSVRIAGFDFPETDIPVPVVGDTPFISSTNELKFSTNHNLMTIQAPLFESITGDIKSAELFAGKQLQVKKGNKYGTIAWLSLTDKPLNETKKSILAISSRIKNQGMTWDGTTTVHNNWGNSPTEVQALDLEILLNIVADSIQVFPLDNAGKPKEGFTVLPQFKDHFLVKFDQRVLQSLWFGIEQFENPSIVDDNNYSSGFSIFPNPVKINSIISIGQVFNPIEYKIIDINGKIVSKGISKGTIKLKGIKKGIYFLTLINDKENITQKLIVT